jgi:CRP/FNR family transcriptional regulator, cyclic AMP receptor protein
MSSKEALLGEVQFFQLLDHEERVALAAMLEEANLEAGAVVFDAGDPGDRMYVVCSGAVELSTTDKLGQPLVLMVARHGDIFGELSLLDEGPRTARAVVSSRQRCWRSDTTSSSSSSASIPMQRWT